MLYEIVADLISENGVKVYVSAIWQAIQNKILGSSIDPKKPNEYQSYEYDTLYRSTVTKTIEGFGAEHDRDHNGRFLRFDLETFVKMGKQFDIDISIQTTVTAVLDNPAVTGVTPSRPENNTKSTDDIQESHKSQEQPIENINKNARDGVTAVTAAIAERPTIYRIGNTDRFGCEGCRIKADRHAMENHQCSGSLKRKSKGKSRLAETAEANESGQGLLDKGEGGVAQ